MTAINRITQFFPDLFRDFRAHVDGFVLIEQDDLRETSARVEVFESEVDSRRSDLKIADGSSDAASGKLDPRVAASMIPIRSGQRFRVWSRDNGPVKLCFLPTDRPHEFVSLDLFDAR